MSKKKKKRQSSAAQSQPAVSTPPAPGSTQSQAQGIAQPKSKNNKQSSARHNSGARTNKTAAPTSFVQRLLGVMTLKPAIYREIAHDHAATLQATIIVVVVALVLGGVNYFASTQVPGLPSSGKPLARSVVIVVEQLLVWLAGAFVIAQVAKNLFQGKTDTNEMLRVFGFTRIFQILLMLGVLSGTVAALVSIAGLALGIIGSIIGIREATGFTTGRAAIVGIFAIVLVAVVVAFFTAFVLNPFVTTLLPT